MYLFGGAYLVSVVITYYCLYTLFMLCFLLSVFPFYVFFSRSLREQTQRTLWAKNSVLHATAIGNSFLHIHQLVLLTLALVGLTLSNPHRFSGQPLTVKIVDKKQSALDAIAIGNSFLHKHQLLLLTLARRNPAKVVEKKQSNPAKSLR